MGNMGYPEIASSAALVFDLLSRPKDGPDQGSSSGVAVMPQGTLAVTMLPLARELQPLQDVLELAYPYLGDIFAESLNEPVAESHPAAVACQRIAETMGSQSGFASPSHQNLSLGRPSGPPRGSCCPRA